MSVRVLCCELGRAYLSECLGGENCLFILSQDVTGSGHQRNVWG